ncbi:MAG: M18 family aminopeptidase [Myxococcales bacterium]|nr:M18 family aminopeptidase [Myxococcales bacterium]
MNAEDFTKGLLEFIDQSPTPFHAVSQAEHVLAQAGFDRMDERERWDLSGRRNVYIVRGGSSLIAVALGAKLPTETGMRIVAAHTDSPNLRLKPLAHKVRHGHHQLGVEVYGSPLLSTWLDRDLSLAGRVWISGPNMHALSQLVRIDKPLLRIPNLAIHLNRSVNAEGLTLNPQEHLVPIVGLERGESFSLESCLTEALKETNSGAPAEILGFDLSLYDCQPSARGGTHNEFVLAPRLDNLACCYAGLAAMREAPISDATRVLVLYDHEECGSGSVVGADSGFARGVLERVLVAAGHAEGDSLHRILALSSCISADMAHAVHPNYAERHEAGHRPLLGGGPVIKTNANQAYATDGEGTAQITTLSSERGISLQHFVSRSDLPCGGTVGPLTASRLGVRTIDIGAPLLAMHSVREMAAGSDLHDLSNLLAGFFLPGA